MAPRWILAEPNVGRRTFAFLLDETSPRHPDDCGHTTVNGYTVVDGGFHYRCKDCRYLVKKDEPVQTSWDFEDGCPLCGNPAEECGGACLAKPVKYKMTVEQMAVPPKMSDETWEKLLALGKSFGDEYDGYPPPGGLL